MADAINTGARIIRTIVDPKSGKEVHIMDDKTFRVFHRFISLQEKPRFATGRIQEGESDETIIEFATDLLIKAKTVFFHEDGTPCKDY